MVELNKIYNCNCLDLMKDIPDDYVDMVLTSPPYDDLRTYNGYSFDFEAVANGLYRIIKPGGVLVWVVGDAVIKGSESCTSFRQALYFKDSVGFLLHDTMIYEKANFTMPQKNRYHQIFEYMFVFTKGKLKTFNPIMDRKNIWVGYSSLGQHSVRLADGTMEKRKDSSPITEYGKRLNIWRMNTAGQENMCRSLPHPAMFPKKLAVDHITSWTNPGDIVYDPMMGSGTTAIACKELGRSYIGSEISLEYCKIAEERIVNASIVEKVEMPLFDGHSSVDTQNPS